MKRLLSMSLVAVLFLWHGTTWAAIGHIIDVQGQVTITPLNGQSQPAVKDAAFDAGATISTGSASRVILRFDDQEVVALRADTRFLVTRYRYLPSEPQSSFSEFALLKGALRALSGLIAKDRTSSFKLTTRTATIGVRGTEFMVADDGGTVYSEVVAGEIQVDNSLGEQILKPGEAAEAPLGEAPKPFLDKERLQKIFDTLRDLPLSNIFQLLNSAPTSSASSPASQPHALENKLANPATAASPTQTPAPTTGATPATPPTPATPTATPATPQATATETPAVSTSPAPKVETAPSGNAGSTLAGTARDSLKLAAGAAGTAASTATAANTATVATVATAATAVGVVGSAGSALANTLSALAPSSKNNDSAKPTAAAPATPAATPAPVATQAATSATATPATVIAPTATPVAPTPNPDAAASSAAAKPAASADAVDMEFWSSIRDSKNPADYKAYLDQFPQGRFHALAENRIQQLQNEAVAAAAAAKAASTAPTAKEVRNEHRIPASVLRVHYHRREGDYGDWGLQVAEEGGAIITRRGSSLEFTGIDDFGSYADIPLALIELPVLDIAVDKDGRRDACKQDRRWVLAQSHEIWIFGDRCDVYYARP